MHEHINNLLFSIDKEIAKPTSSAGKVWRVFVKSGVLRVGDKVKITSVNLDSQPKSALFDIEAEIKSIHEELDHIEGVKEIASAPKGGIVGIDIKNCYFGRKKINKKEISISKQSIGFLSEEPYANHGVFYVRFSNAEKTFDLVDIGRNVILLWFGKMVAAKIYEIPDSLEGMYIALQSGKTLAIPDNYMLRAEITKSTKMLTNYQGKTGYINGLLETHGDGSLVSR